MNANKPEIIVFEGPFVINQKSLRFKVGPAWVPACAVLWASPRAVGRCCCRCCSSAQDLTDVKAGMVADWAAGAAAGGDAVAVKLWLFGSRLGDDGAAAVARMLHPDPKP